MKSKSAGKVRLTSFDDLFGTGEAAAGETVTSVPLSQLHTFKDHPFRVLDDEKMQETVESVKRYGVLMPGIVRPHPKGGYEVIAGHRRWRACELAGLTEMPVIIREMDDDTAVVLMVDTNIQREDILPSEKAKAYRMKYEAMKHQGSKGEKYTADAIGETAGDSGRTVQRYIRLSELVEELLDYVDENKILMVVGEKLSHLKKEEQAWVVDAIGNSGIFPSKAQAELWKESSEAGKLTEGNVYAVLIRKEKENVNVTISAKKIRNYFPTEYSKEQIEDVIYTLLEEWKQKEGGTMDARELQFDYYRGMEAEQYTFYRIPKVLFTAECFKSLSCEAKVLYGLLLDRMSLSIKNRWFDEEDRVYIIFTVEDVMELLNCSRQKAIKNLAELDSEKGIGLIEKKRLGLGKPNVIYVKNFIIKESPEQEEKEPESAVNTQKYENHTSRSMENELQEVPKSYFKEYENQTSGSMKNRLQEVPESYFKKCENQTSRSMENRLQEVPKSNSNNTDIKKTDLSDTEFSETEYSKTDLNDTEAGVPAPVYPNLIKSNLSIADVTSDVIGEMEAYRDIIREHISYECFQDGHYHRREDVDELVELMVEVMMLPDNDTVRIAGMEKPVAIVKNRFMKLNHEHIEYILTCLGANTTKVGNIKAYLLTTLYNAPMTISNFYTAEVNHDLYGSG